MIYKNNPYLIVIVLLFTVCVPLSAVNQYYNNSQFPIGERAAGMGGAYTALANDATALWYNPAGLGRIQKDSIVVSGSTYSYFNSSTDNLYTFTTDGSGSTSSIGMDESSFSVTANSLALTVKLSEKSSLGLGLFIPLHDVMIGDINTRDLAIESGTASISFKNDLALNGSYYIGMIGYGIRLNDTLSAGLALGLGFYSGKLKNINLLHYNSATGESLSSEYLTAEINQVTIIPAVGIQITPSSNFSIGLKAEAPHLGLYGKSRFKSISYTTHTGGIDNSDDSWVDRTVSEDFLERLLPGRISAGIGYSITDRFSFSLDATAIFSIKDSTDFNKTIVNVAAGLEYYLSPGVILRAGFNTDFSQRRELKDDPEVSDGDHRLDYYTGTFSISFAKHRLRGLRGKEEKNLKTFWSTIGIAARFGVGKAYTVVYDEILTESVVFRNKRTRNLQVFIAESVSF